MWGERNCLSFETAVGGIEPPSPRLTVRRCTAWPPLPTDGFKNRFTLLCMNFTLCVSVLTINWSMPSHSWINWKRQMSSTQHFTSGLWHFPLSIFKSVTLHIITEWTPSSDFISDVQIKQVFINCYHDILQRHWLNRSKWNINVDQ